MAGRASSSIGPVPLYRVGLGKNFSQGCDDPISQLDFGDLKINDIIHGTQKCLNGFAFVGSLSDLGKVLRHRR